VHYGRFLVNRESQQMFHITVQPSSPWAWTREWALAEYIDKLVVRSVVE
jgi:hypothetical protein